MNIILSSNIVVANSKTATKIDDRNIQLDGLVIGGDHLSVVYADDVAIIGHIYKDGTFQQLMNSQEIAVNVVTRFMDEFAAIKNYDSIQSAALRAGYSGPFHDEGVKYATWMDGCWAACYAVLDKISKGEMDVPTESELIALMPPKPEF